MSVLLNKEETELIVTCDCGCKNTVHMAIDKLDNESFAFMSWLNGNWYRDQDHKILRVIEKKLWKIWSIIRNKDYHYSEVIMNKEDFLQFRNYINSIEVRDEPKNENKDTMAL